MREIESEIARSMENVLGSRSDRMTGCGITYQGPNLLVRNSDEPHYTSELSVTLLKNGNIEDVLEFHVFDHGEQIVTREEAVKWFEEHLDKSMADLS